MKYAVFLISAFLLIHGPLLAQESRPWSLQECVEYAIEHNATLKKEEYSYETKELSVKEKEWAFAPTITANSSFSASRGRVLDQTTYEFIGNSRIGTGTYSIVGNVTLFNGFRSLFELDLSKLDLKAAFYQAESKENELRKMIIDAYFLIKCNEAAIESSKHIRDIVCSQLDIIEKRLMFGRAIETDFLSAKSLYYEADCDVVTAEGNLEISKNNLCYLLGINPPLPFTIENVDSVDVLCTDDLDIITESLPEYLASEIGIKIAEKERKIVQSYFSPTLSLSLGYGSSFSTARKMLIEDSFNSNIYKPYPFMNQLIDNASYYFTLNLSIPIFNRYSTKIQDKKAVIAIENARVSFSAVTQKLHQEMNQLKIECHSAYKKSEMAEQEFIFAESTELNLREKYKLGLVDYNTWNTSLVNLAKARYNLVEAKYLYLAKAQYAQFILCNHINY